MCFYLLFVHDGSGILDCHTDLSVTLKTSRKIKVASGFSLFLAYNFLNGGQAVRGDYTSNNKLEQKVPFFSKEEWRRSRCHGPSSRRCPKLREEVR